MEKTLSMGAFAELSEREVMETEGGIAILPIVIILGAAALLTGCSSSDDSSSDSSGGGGTDGGSKGLYPNPDDYSDYRCV